MPRGPRLLLSQSYYHIITRGNNRNVVFKSKKDFLYYFELLTKYKKGLPFDLYHYCLMPNHIHLLVRTKKASNFSLFMKKINLSYYHYYRKQYGWTGHFWQNRFKSQPVGKDEYFIQCGKYIELNPVRAGIVKTPDKYQYSSHSYYVQGGKDHLITPDFFYEELGKTITERRRKYKKMMISNIVVDNYKNKTWGSDKQRYNERKKMRYHLR